MSDNESWLLLSIVTLLVTLGTVFLFISFVVENPAKLVLFILGLCCFAVAVTSPGVALMTRVMSK